MAYTTEEITNIINQVKASTSKSEVTLSDILAWLEAYGGDSVGIAAAIAQLNNDPAAVPAAIAQLNNDPAAVPAAIAQHNNDVASHASSGAYLRGELPDGTDLNTVVGSAYAGKWMLNRLRSYVNAPTWVKGKWYELIVTLHGPIDISGLQVLRPNNGSLSAGIFHRGTWPNTDGVTLAISPWTPIGRIPLLGNTTFYVRADGNDVNDGLTESAAFKTITAALLHLRKNVDGCGFAVTIDIGEGTWVGISIARGSLCGISTLIIRGAGTDKTIIEVSPGGNAAVSIFCQETKVMLMGIKLYNGKIGLFVEGAVSISNVDFGPSSVALINISHGGAVKQDGPIKISGGATRAINALFGEYSNDGQAITVLNNPSFNSFVQVQAGGSVRITNAIITGALTGKRYLVMENGVLNTGGKGANYLPGTVAGVTESGGIYL